MQVNQETGVPTITASSGKKATLTDIKVDGKSVLAANTMRRLAS